MDIIVSASLLGCNLAKLGEEISFIESSGADWIHFDVMDGTFVPNISFGEPVLKFVKKSATKFIDTHLMIVKPERYIDNYADLGSDMITFHYESTENTQAVIDKIHSKGIKAGIAIKPEIPYEDIEKYISKVEMVLVMTVNPGFGGQSFIPSTLGKVALVREYICKNNLQCYVQVDGGINDKTAKLVKNAGADCLVSGSYIFGAVDKAKAIASLR